MAATPVSLPMSSKQSQFDALVRATSADLYRYAYWLCRNDSLAQDLVQETYLRAWRALSDLKEGAAAKAWLITILRREHARLYERKRFDYADVEQSELVDHDSLDQADQSEHAQLRAAIGSLDAKYREPLVLQVLGGYGCEEIAGILGITRSAVMTQLFRARQKLKAMLDPDRARGKVHELY